MSEPPALLPLGSAVRVESDEETYVIVARGFQKSADGFLAGYRGVRHPVGSGTGARDIVITEKQIVNVIHRGYESPEDGAFTKKQLESAKSPPAKVATVEEPNLTLDLTKPSLATAPTAQPAVSAVSNSRDPFSELRRKGKRR